MRKRLEQYKAIFFDAGDTLITLPGAQAIIRDYLAARSFQCLEEEVGLHLNEAIRVLYYEGVNEHYQECTPESDRRYWIQMYEFMLERLGAGRYFSEEAIHQIGHELYDVFTGPEHYCLFDDVMECLTKVSERGFKMGVISNFAPTLRNILQSKGILHFFDPVIVSTEVGLEKPNPAIFRLALERAGLAAQEVLYIGDHDRNDLWAPAQIGIDALKIKRYNNSGGAGIVSLRELLINPD